MTALSELVTRTYRDLADEARKVFTVDQVEDFVRGGIAELNRLAPVDTYDDIAFADGTYEYPTNIVHPYAVRLYDADGKRYADLIQTQDFADSVTYGWNHRVVGSSGLIELPASIVEQEMKREEGVDRHSLRVYGYGNRPMPYKTETDPGPPPTYDDPEVPLGEEEQFSVREYAKSQGFDLLAHDRGLFAQWQGQSNNTDVSPTQMLNMADSAKSAWERRSRKITTVRRYW